jgi:CheY-like chemotaxis protein
VLLVDDTPDMLRLMRLLFDFHGGVRVIAEAHDGLQAVHLWRRMRPDVVVMDLAMPVMTGLESAAQILAADPDQRIVLFSATLRSVDKTVADAIGVAECVDKGDLELLPEIVAALRQPSTQS